MIDSSEDGLEQWVIEMLGDLGWTHVYGPDIAPGEARAERSDYTETILVSRLRAAVIKLNPRLTADAVEDVLRTVLRVESPAVESENWRCYRFLIEGVPVEFRDDSGAIRNDRARLVDWDDPANNDLAAINQFTVKGPKKTRRPDILLFVNGLPLALFELKRTGKQYATIKGAHRQTQTYRSQIPELFRFNQACVVSDGTEALAGSFTAPRNHWSAWKTIDGEDRDPKTVDGHRIPAIEVLVRGMFRIDVFFDLCRNFIATFGDGTDTRKVLAKYHQYWAVNKAIDRTLEAVETDGRIGVIWHTQGSGKSFEMAFYAGKTMRHPGMDNPTVVVLTDRNDLDEQLLGETFAPSKPGSPLPESPVQADSREHLRELLAGRQSGGIIFTTLQKFGLSKEDKAAGRSFPTLSKRHNIVVMVDEAHRSNYDLIDGFARNVRDALPSASFIGFTGTPIDEKDKSTTEVFGNVIDTYDMVQGIKDGVTVKVLYEPRLAEVELPAEARDEIDEEVEKATGGLESDIADRLKTRFAKIEAIVGSEKRINELAADIVEHWEQRREAMLGKGMIVTMSRRIAVDLYDAIVKLRPDWHSDDDKQGAIKVVITGDASDPARFQPHLRSKSDQREMKLRACDPDDPLELVIVRDMWLTGFDSPPMHTMYIDKPMRSAGLMQAITRVNRTFKDKPAGLVVDYIGIAENLSDALKTYTERDQDEQAIGEDVRTSAIPEVLAEHSVVSALLHGVDWVTILESGDAKAWVYAVQAASDYLLESDLAAADSNTDEQNDGDFLTGSEDGALIKKRFMAHAGRLRRLFALVSGRDEVAPIRGDVAFFDAVRATVAKATASDRDDDEDGSAGVDTAIRQIISKHVSGAGVVDLLAEEGLDYPDISVIDEEFAKTFETTDNRNLKLEAVRRLIESEVKLIERTNLVVGRQFSEMLSEALNRYRNKSITSADVMRQIVTIAQGIKALRERGEQTGLSDDELAFYDALCTNEAAREALEDEMMRRIAHELTVIIRRDAKTDWNVKETVRAKLRTSIKRLLLKYGYPPDAEARATELVLEQAEIMAENAA